MHDGFEGERRRTAFEKGEGKDLSRRAKTILGDNNLLSMDEVIEAICLQELSTAKTIRLGEGTFDEITKWCEAEYRRRYTLWPWELEVRWQAIVSLAQAFDKPIYQVIDSLFYSNLIGIAVKKALEGRMQREV